MTPTQTPEEKVAEVKKKYKQKWWESKDPYVLAVGQLFEPILIIPFSKFHECIEVALGRPVFTHEFGLNMQGLQDEILGKVPKPTFQDIIDLIPAEKRIIITPSL